MKELLKLIKNSMQIFFILFILFPLGLIFKSLGFLYAFCVSCFREGIRREEDFPSLD